MIWWTRIALFAVVQASPYCCQGPLTWLSQLWAPLTHSDCTCYFVQLLASSSCLAGKLSLPLFSAAWLWAVGCSRVLPGSYTLLWLFVMPLVSGAHAQCLLPLEQQFLHTRSSWAILSTFSTSSGTLTIPLSTLMCLLSSGPPALEFGYSYSSFHAMCKLLGTSVCWAAPTTASASPLLLASASW
ncbi:hypothetical protein F5141DRAFT_1065825 [Pisolithus sp. B1]|nr:hypothetical protein F5141DRAFT_1065825 [Pisolithus sp. B1]